MKIVLDTNVLVSGLLNPYGVPGRIVQMVAAGTLVTCYNARILGEHEEVLRRPLFGFQTEQIEALVEQLRVAGESITSASIPHQLPDPDDVPFLEIAVAGKVGYLVTGNTKHYPARCCRGVSVVTPAALLVPLLTFGGRLTALPTPIRDPCGNRGEGGRRAVGR